MTSAKDYNDGTNMILVLYHADILQPPLRHLQLFGYQKPVYRRMKVTQALP
jgi:hypothetical protein